MFSCLVKYSFILNAVSNIYYVFLVASSTFCSTPFFGIYENAMLSTFTLLYAFALRLQFSFAPSFHALLNILFRILLSDLLAYLILPILFNILFHILLADLLAFLALLALDAILALDALLAFEAVLALRFGSTTESNILLFCLIWEEVVPCCRCSVRDIVQMSPTEELCLKCVSTLGGFIYVLEGRETWFRCILMNM